MTEAVPAASPHSPTARPGGATLSGPAFWLGAFGLALANFVVILDTTITNVSVPHIAGSLAVSPSQGIWTITSYAVAEAITVPLSGWLATRFGTYRTLVWSLSGFALFSLLCGLARTIELLVVVRVLQGLCGGPLMPMTQTLMLRIFPRERLASANALWGVTAISAPIVGPLTGGWITDNWSWPWIFFINLPVIAVCLGIVIGLLRSYETPTRRERIDVVGLVLLILFIGALQLVLDLGRERDWFGSTLIVCLAIVSLVSFCAFVIWELTEDHPVVDLKVLRHRNLAVGLSLMPLGYGGLFAMIVLIPLWLQSTVGYTAGDAGNVMAMVGICAVISAPIATKIMQHSDMRIWMTVGIVWLVLMAVLRMHWTADATFWDYALPQLLQGLGMPFFFFGTMTVALAGLPQADIGTAAGLMSFVRTVSGAMGTATATSLWDESTRQARAELVSAAGHSVDQLASVASSADQSALLLEQLIDVQAATIGAAHVYGVAGLVMLAAAGLVWLLPRITGAQASGAGGAPGGH